MDIKEKQFIRYLKRFDEKPFRIIIKNDEYLIGNGEPTFTARIEKIPPLKDLLNSTSLTLGEAYMRGEIDIYDDLYTALHSLLGQIGKFSSNQKIQKKLIFTSTSKSNQEKEVTSHYDIGNSFYKIWLDPTMSYSCGYFRTEDDTLEQAQLNKIHLILDKLCLEKDMTLCDIGCGWGFLLIEAAKKYGVNGLGITLSKEQKKAFEEKIKKEGLENQLSVELIDYRDLPKTKMKFDRVVSVGMIEHVGRPNYKLFMQTVNKILKPGGLFLLHFISALKESPGDPWIKKYIFPGGVIPSLREIEKIVGDLDFYTVDIQSLRRHYAKTLLCWYNNFLSNRDKVVDMFDEEFARMWELYLCSCAAGFDNGVVDLHQILYTKGINNSLPMTPWYR